MFLQRRLNSICWGRPPDVVESFTNNKLVELCWELFWYYILGWLMYTAWGTTIGLFIGEYTEINYLSLFSDWKRAFWWILFSFHQRVHGLCTRRTWHQVKGWNYESERKCICTQRGRISVTTAEMPTLCYQHYYFHHPSFCCSPAFYSKRTMFI